MTFVNVSNVNFEFGEIDPIAIARFDLKIGQNGLERCQNHIVEPHGPVRFRNGFRFVHYTRFNAFAVFIPFQFNDQQSYLIEATDSHFRFYKDEALITETGLPVSGITTSNPGVVTSIAHGFNNGDEVFLNGVQGMVEVNGRSYKVANKTANTFELQDIWGANVETNPYGVYTSGGVASRVYEISTPYTEADLEGLQFTQNADTMYIVSQKYEPRKLTRTGHTAWTLATFSRTNDPFNSSARWPRTVTFTSDGRILYGSTPEKPATLFFSRGPASGGSRYDDFTTGTADNDAVTYTLAPVKGKADSIQWLTNTDKFIVAGTYSTVMRVFGSTEATSVTVSSVNAKSVNTFGSAAIAPVTVGSTLFYIERGGVRIRSFEYNFQTDAYESINRNLVTEHLTHVGVKQIVYQNSSPNVVWVKRTDGVLIGLTYEQKEGKAGWHRHYTGGDDSKVLSIGQMPRATQDDQLWAITERFIDGKVVRMVEYMADKIHFPVMEDFYTGDETGDTERFGNALYEAQKQSIHLDASLTYNGSTLGVVEAATLTLSAAIGTSVPCSSNVAIFTPNMVGRQIWKKYGTDGRGGGRAEITGFIDTTHIIVNIIKEFYAFTMLPGDWFLTATTVNNLRHLEGETVSIEVDGAVAPMALVSDGEIILEEPASVIHIGLPYVGMLKSMNLEFGGVNGGAQSKPRQVAQVDIRFLNSVGPYVGTSLYALEPVGFRGAEDYTDRPTPLSSGYESVQYGDLVAKEKHLYLLQTNPLPCIVQGLEVYGDTSNE